LSRKGKEHPRCLELTEEEEQKAEKGRFAIRKAIIANKRNKDPPTRQRKETHRELSQGRGGGRRGGFSCICRKKLSILPNRVDLPD